MTVGLEDEMLDRPLKLTECVRTNTGGKRHRPTCRFTAKSQKPCQDNPVDRALTPCATCKPHVAENALPHKSVGKENLLTCQVCMKGQAHGPKTKTEAESAGFKTTKTGTRYHVAECKFAGGPGVKAPQAAPKAKPIKAVQAPKGTNLAPAVA